jgi:hypothetical protein
MNNINLNIDDDQEAPLQAGQKPEAQTQNNRAFLQDLNLHDVSRVFARFGSENRHLIVPIGFPQAGKSLLLSSLMYYARKGNDTLFRTNIENDFPFDKGRIATDQMVEHFDKGKIYEATQKGSLDLIGINVHPSKTKLPSLKLAFLDLAGEDIKSIKTSEAAEFTDKINAVFNGVKLDNSPIIFVLITPFDPPKKDFESSSDAHAREDALHYDFLNYLNQNQPELLKSSKFFVVVSQWDKNTDKSLTVEAFIKNYRESIFNYVKNSNVVWGEFSVGKLLVSNVNGINKQSIEKINFNYPSRFWKKLYNICTYKDLDHKTWFEKLFG